MIEKTISPANIQSMLETLRSYQTQAALHPSDVPNASGPNAVDKTSFANLITGALDQVSAMEDEANKLQVAYERGEDLPLTDVVLGMQKSSIAFEATLQIRNKVLKAYEDVLNMPV